MDQRGELSGRRTGVLGGDIRALRGAADGAAGRAAAGAFDLLLSGGGMMISWTAIRGSRAVRAVGLETIGIGSGTRVRIHVRFRRSGKTYVYDVGNIDYFERFVSAASKGRFYVYVIKQRFDYV